MVAKAEDIEKWHHKLIKDVTESGMLDSKIFSNEEDKKWLKEKIEMIRSQPCFKLIYRASEDGYSTETFHKRCDNRGASLIIANTNVGIIGGFTIKAWDSSTTVADVDPKSFIFEIKNHKVTLPAKGMGNEIPTGAFVGPVYGIDFQIGVNYHTGKAEGKMAEGVWRVSQNSLHYNVYPLAIVDLEVFQLI